MSRELPILCSAQEVRTILAGRQTHVRRVVLVAGKLAAEFVDPAWNRVLYEQGNPRNPLIHSKDGILRSLGPCPYGQSGDLLWVREGFGESPAFTGGIVYRADEPEGFYRWRPSIHMPKWACRLWLRVEDVRVERLQEITREDAIAEGAFEAPDEEKQQAARVALSEGRHEIGPRDYFRELWDTINGSRAAWRTNPWCWCIKFSRVDR